MTEPRASTGEDLVLAATQRAARRWLTETAAPFWWARGVERGVGGFAERIGQDGAAVVEPRRVRVSARQVYAFAVAAELGWDGPVAAAVEHGLAFLKGPGAGADGLIVHRVDEAGRVLDAGPDLYDQSFLLLALARARAFDPNAEQQALGVLAALGRRLRHPVAGYEDRLPPVLPLRANPHMHLLEAALAWMAVSDDPAWRDLGARMVAMCRDRFRDPATGALLEYFDADWQPLAGPAGDVVEPGHLFEWCWLLWSWQEATGEDTAAIALAFAAIARRHGTDARRGVALDELTRGLAVAKPGARLWPQTERLKAGIACHALAADDVARAEAAAEILAAWSALERYLATPVPGLWHDRMTEEGRFVDEPAPASSFYHLAAAIRELARFTRKLPIVG
jgi:mannose-6-phosphate isomerase